MADLSLTPPPAIAEDEFRGRIGALQRGKSRRAASGVLGGRLTKLLAGKKISGARLSGLGAARSGAARGFPGDARQRVVAKLSFHTHAKIGGGGGGGKLLAHASYLQRDGAAREHEPGHFYDRTQDVAEDARERLGYWAVEDKRHFRLMLAPESGARLIGEDGDLKAFTRETMARVERDLGVGLDWLAVDHGNTDNPHVHVIVRGVRTDGVDLILPRAYVAHGLREAARDIATQHIGERGVAEERLRLDREIEGRGFNRLDRALERQLGDRSEVLVQELGRGGDPAFADALRARARELARIGLAQETRRNVLRFEPDWTERLAAMQPLDVRRQLARARLYEPRMGRIAGQVLELGPRGEHPDRALLVIETPAHGRVLINTSKEAIQDLQRGSLVALAPAGKRAAIERLAFHGLAEQVAVSAETELDRELDRIARGATRRLPELPEVTTALAQRAAALEAQGLGVRAASGKFYFRDGARDGLRQAELERVGLAQAHAEHRVWRDLGQERGGGEERAWKVREVKELFAGKAALLERGRELALALLQPGAEIAIGDYVAFKQVVGPARVQAPPLEMVKQLGRGLDLGR